MISGDSERLEVVMSAWVHVSNHTPKKSDSCAATAATDAQVARRDHGRSCRNAMNSKAGDGRAGTSDSVVTAIALADVCMQRSLQIDGLVSCH